MIQLLQSGFLRFDVKLQFHFRFRHVMQNYFLMQLSNENIKLPPHDTARHGDLLTKQPINVAGDVSNDTISLLWVQVI